MSLSPLSCLKVVSSTLSFLGKKPPNWDLWFYQGASYNTEYLPFQHIGREISLPGTKRLLILWIIKAFSHPWCRLTFPFSEGSNPTACCRPQYKPPNGMWSLLQSKVELLFEYKVSCITPLCQHPRPTKCSPTLQRLNKAEWCSFFFFLKKSFSVIFLSEFQLFYDSVGICLAFFF